MKTKRLVATIALLCVAGLVSGCGSDEPSEKAAEKLVESAIKDGSDSDVDVDVDGEKVTIESEDGKITAGGTERPESLPANFPLAEGEITYAMESPSSVLVVVQVEGDIKAAFDNTVSELEAQGWTRQMVSSGDGEFAGMFQGETEDDALIVAGDAAEGTLSYSVTRAE